MAVFLPWMRSGSSRTTAANGNLQRVHVKALRLLAAPSRASSWLSSSSSSRRLLLLRMSRLRTSGRSSSGTGTRTTTLRRWQQQQGQQQHDSATACSIAPRTQRCFASAAAAPGKKGTASSEKHSNPDVPPTNSFEAERTAGGGYMQTGHRSDRVFEGTTRPPRILVTGAVGQIGSELVQHLSDRYGEENVIATDIKNPSHVHRGPNTFLYLDVLDQDNLARILLEHRVDWIVHLASLLSALGEQNPQLAMRLNTRGIENVLEAARHNRLRVFAPSTIGVCGPSTPKDMMADLAIMRPTTMYGITKVYLELLGEYYHKKYGVDFRSIRYPGIISYVAMPGGGTTDYAVEIFHKALSDGKYKCFLEKDCKMPMLYMPDCLLGTMQLLEAPEKSLTQRVYNVTNFSFTPEELYESIKKQMPEFEIEYEPDFRQSIADTWPRSMDDSAARRDWGFDPRYTLDDMSRDMIAKLWTQYR